MEKAFSPRNYRSGTLENKIMNISETSDAQNNAQITQTAEFNRIFSHRKTKVNNINLHFVWGGSGETAVILLHGWLGTWYS